MTMTSRVLGLALLVLPVLRAEDATAQPPFSVSPQALVEAFEGVKAPADAPVTILLEEGRFAFAANHALTLHYRLIFKALTRTGADNWAMIQRSWAPWHEMKPEIHARVITADGLVHELDPKTIAEGSASEDENDVVTDRRQLKAPLPAMAEGSIVEEEIVARESSPLSPSGSVFSFTFGADVPTARTRVTVSAAPGLELHYHLQLLPDVKTTRSDLPDGSAEITFDQGPMEKGKDLPALLAPDRPRRPRLMLGVGRDWQTVATEYAAMVDGQIGSWNAGKYLPAMDGGLDREGKISAIVSWLNREIRYTGVEFGDASIMPRPPAEVLKRKYGDCKDKSTLLVALLRAAGIKANVALLQSGTGVDIDAGLPAMNVFDHAIVYVPGDPDLWLDPTDPDLRVGVIPAADQGRLALVASPTTTALLHTPEATSAGNRIVETREFKLAESGPADVTETSETWGAIDADYRGAYRDKATQKVAESLKDYVQWTYRSTALPVVGHFDPDDLSRPFQLRLQCKKAGRGTTEKADAAVGILLSQVAIRLPEFFRTEPKKEEGKPAKQEPEPARTDDFMIAEPYLLEWRYHILPPPGFKVRELPETREEKLGPASLSYEFKEQPNGAVTGTVKFDVPKRRLTAAEGIALRDAVVELQKRAALLVSFDQTGETLLAAGKVREALASFRELRKLHWYEALHCDQVARALLAAGAGEAARFEARLGVDLEPKSATAWTGLAEVLQYDLVGRRLRKGYDRAGAIAAYRKAIELDPADDQVRASLAIMLEYDDTGARYSKNAEVGEAVAEYQKISSKRRTELGLQVNLAVALFRSERMKELRELLKAEPDSATNRGLDLAALAVLDGPEAAAAAARAKVSGVQNQQATLMEAARNLLVLRRYPIAAELFLAGAAAAPNPVATRNLVETLRRTRPVEELPEPTSPDGLARKIVSMFTKGNLKDFAGLFSRDVNVSIDEDDEIQLREAQAAGRAEIRRQGLTPEVALDIAAAMLHPTVEGSDEFGYRVRTNLGLAGTDITIYTLREDGRQKILALSREGWEGMVRHVLHLADANEFEPAGKWLDWAREEVEPPSADDPLAPPQFPYFWKAGQTREKAAIRTAAAVLLSSDSEAKDVIPILEEAVRSAQPGVTSQRLAYAVASAYMKTKAYDKAEATASELVRQAPESRAAFELAARAAAKARHLDGLERLIADHLEHFRSDPAVLRAAAKALVYAGGAAHADTLFSALVRTGKSEAEDYNWKAWNDMIDGKITDATHEAIGEAIRRSPHDNAAMLHTLAAIQAETDKPNEARATLLQRMELQGSDEPNAEDWYVLGRIAEQYGLADVAGAMYKRVRLGKDKGELSFSSYTLAQRRLEVIVAGERPAAK